MGKFDVFEIELSKNGPYISGETVAGQVLLKSKKERDVARITVHLYGGGRVEFTEVRGAQENAAVKQSPTFYQDSQTYLRLTQVVLLDGRPLAKGQLHRLSFELRLPERLPSSFMTVITYTVTAMIERSAPGKSCALTKPLIVIGNVDLNRLQPHGSGDFWLPIEAWGHWRSCTGQQQHSQQQQQQLLQRLDEVGLATARLVVNKRAFSIGETIRLCVHVHNGTKQRLESVRVCLTQKSELRAAAANGLLGRREQRLAVQHCCLQDRLKPGASSMEENALLPVPWVATAMGSTGCRLLRVKYFLQVICSVTADLRPVAGVESPVQSLYLGPKYDKCEQVLVLLEEPATIGTKPLLPTGSDSAAAGAAAPAAVSAASAIVPSAPPDFLQDLTMFSIAPSAPPSYEESMQQLRHHHHQQQQQPLPVGGEFKLAASGFK